MSDFDLYSADGDVSEGASLDTNPADETAPENSAEETPSAENNAAEAVEYAEPAEEMAAEETAADEHESAETEIIAESEQTAESEIAAAPEQIPEPETVAEPIITAEPEHTADQTPGRAEYAEAPRTRIPAAPAAGYRQQGYQPQGQPQAYAPQYGQQPYPNQNYGQPSQGYYSQASNEYIYSPKPPKKKSNAGKIAIIAISGILAVFVIAIASISAYNFFTLKNGVANGSNLYANKSGGSLTGDNDVILDDYNNENDEIQGGASDIEVVDDEDEDEPEDAETSAGPTAIRDFPSLEQLAAPEDAMAIPDIYDKLSPSVVGVSCTVRNGTQVGTGFVISEDGYIVTNAHVIEDFLSVMIVDAELSEYEAEVIGYDSTTDIAVLKADLDGKDLIPVEFGKSSELRIGELAIAIGNPLGFDLYGTMTTGIISGLNRTVTVEDNTMNLLQTSAVINNGNSGGPLIDAYGRVIGITSAKVSTQYGEGLGFAIPIDEAIPIIESLIKYGYVPGRPSLGITGQNITELMSFYYRMPMGVYVFSVAPDSGADKAGIVAGDIIIAIQGESVETSEQLNDIKNKYAVGDTVTLTVYRGGENFDIDVVLSESTPEMTGRTGE